MDEKLVRAEAKDVVNHIEAACLYWAQEAIEQRENREFNAVNNSYEDTANWLYNRVDLCKELIEGCRDHAWEGIEEQAVLDCIYALGHDAVKIAILRIRGDNTDYQMKRAQISFEADEIREELLKSGRGNRIRKKKEKQKREKIFGHSVKNALNWMGANNLTKQQAVYICEQLLENQPATGTILLNLSEGRRGKGVAAPFTEDEIDKLYELAEGKSKG